MDESRMLTQALLARSEIEYSNGAQYYLYDLELLDDSFDEIWRDFYGYSPNNLPSAWS